LGIKLFIGFTAILATISADAPAISAAPNSRARPGAVSGVLVKKAQTEARMPGLGVDTCPDCPKTPVTPPVTPPAAPVNPCGDVIPQLGVDICVARNACAGIQADGHAGVFDEATLTCKIPVCAHNWSGLIKKSGEDVCGLIDMGSAMRCDAKLFDQISALRRTSQYVVPALVAGGAGVGAGVGAIIDHKQNKKAEALAAKNDANDRMRVEVGGKVPTTFTFSDQTFDLSKTEDVEKLKKYLSGPELTGKIVEANKIIDSCAKEMFKELVSLSVRSSKKWGRIKISKNADACASDINEYIYCQFQNLHAKVNNIADCDEGKFSTYKGINPYVTGVESKNPATENYHYGSKNNQSGIYEGKCYFRDSQGSGEVGTDATVQSDLWRAEFLNFYKNNAKINDVYNDSFREDLISKLGAYTFDYDIRNAVGVSDNILNYVLIKGTIPFNSITNMQSLAVCDMKNIDALLSDKTYVGSASEMSGGQTNNILMEAYGALEALNGLGPLDGKLSEFLTQIKFITVHAEAIANVHAGLGNEVRKEFGKERGFFEKAVGRGLLIGTGVGAVAGLGYWFAEGAGTFCNVGGLEQVKLNKGYSVPSFREYLLNRGFMK
jgi:hypothetical protein